MSVINSYLECESIESKVKTHTNRSKSPSYCVANEKWPIEKIVLEFIQLNESKKRGEMYDFLKIKNIKPQAKSEYTFTPIINEKSRQIDKCNNISQYIGQNIDESFPLGRNKGVFRSQSNSPLSNLVHPTNYNTNQESELQEESYDLLEPSYTRHTLLYEKSKVSNPKLEKLSREIKKKAMVECTFHPSITPLATHLKVNKDPVKY